MPTETGEAIGRPGGDGSAKVAPATKRAKAEEGAENIIIARETNLTYLTTVATLGLQFVTNQVERT
jgi:phosphohistidine swiveling domain-containing protein